MRKIDAVLLSTLILYDYSAQSFVDNNKISLEHDVTSSTGEKLANNDYTFTPSFTDNETVVRGAKKINPDASNITTDVNTISFHELAKVNAATAIVASQGINAEHINIAVNVPAPSETEIPAPDAFLANAESVNINATHYSVDISSEEKINEQVAAVADMSTFDSDNDGTYDTEDKCPGTVGVARFEGCPVPDSDADGINDEEDRCPLEKGTDDGYGCPVTATDPTSLEAIAQTTEMVKGKNNQFNFIINFDNNNKILSSEDFNIVLQLTDILIRTPDAKIEIQDLANANNSILQTPVSLLENYLKDLGVLETQIIIKEQMNDVPVAVADGKNKVEMKIKL